MQYLGFMFKRLNTNLFQKEVDERPELLEGLKSGSYEYLTY